jgi:hypothetical protein
VRGWGALYREDALEVFDEVVSEPLEPSLLLRRRRIHEVLLQVHAHSRASAADERRKRVVQQPRHDLYHPQVMSRELADPRNAHAGDGPAGRGGARGGR